MQDASRSYSFDITPERGDSTETNRQGKWDACEFQARYQYSFPEIIQIYKPLKQLDSDLNQL